MTRHRLLPGLLALCITAAAAPVSAQRITAIDPAGSEIRFVSTQMNVPVEGRFRRFTGKLDFDPARAAASRAEIEVDLNSIDTGSDEADTEVKTKGWFNIAVFPTAKFVSSSVKPAGAGRYEVAGKLTIKGKSMDVTAPVTVRQDGASTVFEGGFTLLRLQFGIGEGVWSDTETVANEVQVRFRLVGLGRKP
jgi:polyisoprenoid-binding protein YceI